MRSWLSPLAVILALGAGVIHLLVMVSLFVLPSGPPPGAGAAPPSAPPPGGSPLMMLLPYLFVLNFLGFSALAALFVLVRRASVTTRVFVDGLLGLMAIATLIGWNSFHRPNPHGMGTIALVVELALIVAVVVHATTLQARRAIPSVAG